MVTTRIRNDGAQDNLVTGNLIWYGFEHPENPVADRENDNVTHMLRRFSPQPVESDDEDLGECASRPVVKYVPAFHVKNGKEPTRSFEYGHMGFKQFEPSMFKLEFHEPEHWRLTVQGMKLWKLYNYLNLHRLEWIEKADHPFEDGNQPVFKTLTVEAVDEEAGE